MNPFEAIGNFFGFGKKKKEEEKPRTQVTVQKPITLVQAPNQTMNRVVSPTMPSSTVVQNQQQPFTPEPIIVGGVQPTKPLTIENKRQEGTKLVANGAPEPTPVDNRPTIQKVNDFVGSANRTGARALFGGLANIGNLITTGFNVDETKARTEEQLTAVGLGEHSQEGLGKGINYDSGASKAGNVAGTVIGNAPFVANQVGLAAKGAGLISQAPTVAKIATLGAPGRVASFGISEGVGGIVPSVITGAAVDPQTTLKSTAENAAIDATLGALGGALPNVLKAVRRLRGAGEKELAATGVEATAGIKPLDDVADEIRRGEEAINEPVVVRPEAPRPPSDPITSSPTTNKPDAITSPNRPPTVQQPTINIPQQVTNEAPMIQAPVIPEAKPLINAPVVRTPDEAVAEVQKQIDEAAVKEASMPAPSQVLEVETPNAARSREIAEATPPSVPVSEAQLARQAANDAPTEAIETMLTIGNRKARLTPEQIEYLRPEIERINNETFSDGQTFKNSIHLTTGGGNKRRTEATLEELAQENPRLQALLETMPGSAPTGELGRVAQSTIQAGRQLDDAGWEALSKQVGEMANKEAAALGTDVPSILKKVQTAYDNRKTVKTARDAGLSEQEFDLYKRMTNEITYLRDRTDPSLLGQGNIDRWYSPRQTPDTEFDPSLTNEISRGANGPRTDQLDLTTVPIEQAIRRYGNAPRAISEDVISQVETKKITENGNTQVIESGIKVPDDAKQAFENSAKEYTRKNDEVEIALAQTDVSPKEIDRLVDEAHAEMDDAFSQLISSIPKNTPEGREAIARLQERRGAYIQSTIRTNMFSNVVNRALDQIGSNVVRATNQMAGIADSLASVATGRRALSTGGAARTIARDYSKGALKNNLMRDARSSVAVAGDSVIAKGDAMFRAAGTVLTGSSDLTTTAVKMTNRMMLARAQALGITDKAGMEKYLRENINSPEYKELLTGVSDIYNGYLGLPTSITSRLGNNGRWLANVDNLVNKGLERFAPVLPPRARKELNDLIMPALSGFAGATYRIGKKALNSSMLGIPGIVKGSKLMREGGEASQQIGQMVMVRSMIDGLVGGAAGAATIGAMLANEMEWTGEYPSDPNEAALWERQGIVPNSLSFKTGQMDENGNEVRIQIQPGRVLGPFSLPVVLPAVIKSGGDVGDVFDATMGQMLENMGADGVLRNAGNISTALTGSGYAREKAIENLMSSAGFSVSNVVPLSGFQNNVANALDGSKRDTSGNRFTDSIANRNPFTRPGLPEKVDNLGDPVRNNTTLGSQAMTTALVPPTGAESSESADSFDSEVTRLASAGFKDVMPGADIKNGNAKTDANTLLGSKLYQNASDEQKAEYMKKTLLGTDFKDINAKLEPAQRTALIEHKLQTEDQRKVWLEDNDNAVNYFEAKFKNKEVSGTLTTEDKDMNQTGSLAQYVAAAKVDRDNQIPQELTQLFKSTNKTEFKKMDAAQRDMLYAYDLARVKAGLPEKFGAKTGSGGDGSGGGRGGSGSGGGSDKFSFASLPASLIGTTANKGYANEAPTFKPIADLRAPSRGGIPKGRTISVKKGIQI